MSYIKKLINMTITLEKNIILQVEIVEKTRKDVLNALEKIPGVVHIEMLDSYQESVDKYGWAGWHPGFWHIV